jgi:hypothetical protein
MRIRYAPTSLQWFSVVGVQPEGSILITIAASAPRWIPDRARRGDML